MQKKTLISPSGGAGGDACVAPARCHDTQVEIRLSGQPRHGSFADRRLVQVTCGVIAKRVGLLPANADAGWERIDIAVCNDHQAIGSDGAAQGNAKVRVFAKLLSTGAQTLGRLFDTWLSGIDMIRRRIGARRLGRARVGRGVSVWLHCNPGSRPAIGCGLRRTGIGRQRPGQAH